MNPLDFAYTAAYINSVKGKRKENTDASAMQQQILKICPHKNILNVFFYRNDFHNLKVFLKNNGKDLDSLKRLLIFPCVYNTEKIYGYVKENKFGLLPHGLKEAAKKAAVLIKNKDLQQAEMIIDKASMDFSLIKAKESKNKFAESLIMLENTLTDIKIALRCAENRKNEAFIGLSLSEKSEINKNALTKAAASGKDELLKYLADTKYRFRDFDSFYRREISGFFERSRYMFFGIEPVIYYIYGLEMNLKE